jgi:hypothetical protein
MRIAIKISIFLSALVAILGASPSNAQQSGSGQQQSQSQGQPQQKPLDTRINPPTAPANANDNGTADQVNPDTHALSGVETYGVGGVDRSYFVPSAQFSEYADSNGTYTSSGSSVQPVTSVGGQLVFRKVHRRQDFSLQYSGGGVFFDRGNQSNYTYQQMSATEKINWRRGSISLSDYFSYLPDSGYGAGGFGTPFGGGPPNLFGIGGIPFGLNPGFVSSQSIFTSAGRRFNNSSIGEVDYNLGPRSSVTGSVGYDLLHYFGSSLLNSNTVIVRGGYNYQMNPLSTVSLIYGGSIFHYDQFPIDNFQAHSIQVAYGRRITGRMGLQLSAGPQIILPNLGNTITSWTLSASLRYAFQRSDINLSYSRYTSNGGGLYFGAYTDEVRLYGDRQLTRVWSANATASFARNTPISFSGNPIVGASPYDSIYAGVGVSRPIGRYFSAFANYNFQWQSAGFCALAAACGPSFTRHIVGVGINWNFRPIGSPEGVVHALSAGKAR